MVTGAFAGFSAGVEATVAAGGRNSAKPSRSQALELELIEENVAPNFTA
jgi:hypothetical protein